MTKQQSGDMGAVFITGLSASGKTTLAKKLIDRLRSSACPCLLLDSTDMFHHHIMPPFEGFTLGHRKQRARQLINVVNWVAGQGVLPVASVIGQPPEIRGDWHRDIANYTEIYLKCDIATCRRRDNKDLYGKAGSSGGPIVGEDIPFIEPESVSLTLDSAALSPNELLEETWRYLQQLAWFHRFYEKHAAAEG